MATIAKSGAFLRDIDNSNSPPRPSRNVTPTRRDGSPTQPALATLPRCRGSSPTQPPPRPSSTLTPTPSQTHLVAQVSAPPLPDPDPNPIPPPPNPPRHHRSSKSPPSTTACDASTEPSRTSDTDGIPTSRCTPARRQVGGLLWMQGRRED